MAAEQDSEAASSAGQSDGGRRFGDRRAGCLLWNASKEWSLRRPGRWWYMMMQAFQDETASLGCEWRGMWVGIT